MIRSHARRRGLASSLSALVFAAALSVPALALAGEIKFGAAALAVDDEGKLTDAGRSAAKEEVPNATPGEEEWVVHVWAKLDKPAPGGLNVEFYGEHDGKRYLAYRHVEDSFDGAKYISLEIELEGSKGFNKNKTYFVEITQQDDKGRDFKLASGKVKLGWVAAPKPEEGETEGDDKGEPEQDSAAQDALDTISGGGGEGGDGANTGAPPPVEPKKKGCAVSPDAGDGAIGTLALLVLAGAWRRRRA
ncbi:MAG: hypothetical protein U0168_02490 [Nannocystaceae bacterium]|jgi:MYXO-CTERM domain-containing protein